MAKVKVYLKSGQCFDVVAEKIVCRYGTLTGELTSFRYEGATEFPLYLALDQVAAVVQLRDNSADCEVPPDFYCAEEK